MGKTIIIIMFLALCTPAIGEGITWYVDGSVPSSGDGTTWETAFKTIQEGIDAASDGDTVIVAEGTYVENVHFDGKNIILRSTAALDPAVVAKTIIDGNQSASVVTFNGTEDETCILSGFTIRNGFAEVGGGICGGPANSPTRATIQSNFITGNWAVLGGGLAYCGGTIRSNAISGNSADSGGGLRGCHGIIHANTIICNSAPWGAGLEYCNGMISNNRIADNHAEYNGGGLYDCDGAVCENRVAGNSARWGGALADCDGLIHRNAIIANSASYDGGGLYSCGGNVEENTVVANWGYSGGGGLDSCDGLVVSNIIASNSSRGGGGLAWCDGTVRNNTVVWNSADFGGGLDHCNADIDNNTIVANRGDREGGGLLGCEGNIRNCVIWGNHAPDGAQLYDSGDPKYSCVQEWTGGGDGNTSDAPLFVGWPLDTGKWTEDPTFDGEAFKTMLFNTGTSWETDSLKGLFINPDTSQPLQFFITSNTATTITVWGDASQIASTGDAYEIYDYRLRPDSPCIDAGDNSVGVGRFDLDGNYRRVCTKGKPGWSGDVDYIVKEAGGAVTLLWKGFIDMGAYECQVFEDVPETFTISTRERMESGDWIEVFTGNVCTWTDLQAAGRQKFYRVEMR